MPGRGQSTPPEVRFARFVTPGAPDECWPFTGSRGDGYGQFFLRGEGRVKVYVRAHRYAYEQAKGPIPEGMAVDHECHNADKTCVQGPKCPHRACCNPAHLVAKTPVENTLAAMGRPKATYAACRRGHPFTPDNVYVAPGTGDGTTGPGVALQALSVGSPRLPRCPRSTQEGPHRMRGALPARGRCSCSARGST